MSEHRAHQDDFEFRRANFIVPPCQRCGSKAVFVNSTAVGVAEQHFDKHGWHQETLADKTGWKWSTTVRCADCMKIRRDLVRRPGKIHVELVTEGETH